MATKGGPGYGAGGGNRNPGQVAVEMMRKAATTCCLLNGGPATPRGAPGAESPLRTLQVGAGGGAAAGAAAFGQIGGAGDDFDFDGDGDDNNNIENGVLRVKSAMPADDLRDMLMRSTRGSGGGLMYANANQTSHQSARRSKTWRISASKKVVRSSMAPKPRSES